METSRIDSKLKEIHKDLTIADRFNKVTKTIAQVAEWASNQFKTLSDRIFNVEKRVTTIEAIKVFNGKDGKDGKDGYTPVKGQDYFTETEVESIKKDVTPVKGIDYRDGIDGKSIKGDKGDKGDDGYTPKKGEDYFTFEEVQAFKKDITPIKGIDYTDGKDGRDGKDGKGIKGEKGDNGSPDTAEDIIRKLEGSKKKLDARVLKNLRLYIPKKVVSVANAIIKSHKDLDNLDYANSGHTGFEPSLPDTPENPETKYLNGNREWKSVAIGAGGFAGNLYFTTLASTDVSGYKQISYTNEATETELSATLTNQEALLRTYLYDYGIATTIIDAGVWIANYRVKVSGTQGITQMKMEAFLYHEDTTETILWSDYSPEINNTDYLTIRSESNQPAFSCVETDRLGIRIYAKVTASNAITINTIIGDGDASYFTTPLRIRHNQLRDLNGDDNYQHVTLEEKNSWLKLDGSNDPITGDITIQPSTDSATTLVVKDSDGQTAINVDTVNNRTSINPTLADNTSTTSSSLYVYPTESITTSGTHYIVGARVTPTTKLSADVTDAGYIMGLRLYAYRNVAGDAGTYTGGTFGHLIGEELLVGHSTLVDASAYTDIATALKLRLTLSKGTINNYYALYVEPPTIAGGTTLNNYYGIYQPYTTGKNFLGASLALGSDTATAQLQVNGVSDKIQEIIKGYSTQTSNLQEWQNSSGTGLVSITGSGDLGVGTTSPSTRFHLAGSTSSHFAQVDTGLNFTYVVRPPATTAVVQEVAGNIDAGTHRYCISYVTPIGETDFHDVSPTYTFDATHGQAVVNLPVSSDYRVTGRKIYRDTGGNYDFKLVATVNNNTDTTYLDNIADASRTGLNSWYRENTTSGQILFNGVRSLMVGVYNTTLGLNAGVSLSTNGSINTLVGVGAGSYMTDGNQNTCIGYSAGSRITTSSSNTYIGSMSGYNSTGSANAFLGNYSGGIGSVTGSNNAVFGSHSAYNLGAGSNNAFFGYHSGYTGSGSYNMFFGRYSGNYETGSYKLIIDSVDRSNEATARSSALIYGVANSTASSQTLSLGGGGKVGIGTISPTTKLQVVGSSDIVQVSVLGNGSQTANLQEWQNSSGVSQIAISPTGKVVTPNDLTVSCGTDKTLVLEESVWDDIQFGISTGKVPSSNYPDWDTFTTNTSEYKFDVNDYINLGANELAHWWKEGTDVHPHLHIALDGANTSGSNQYVKFAVYIAYADASEVWTETTANIETTIANGTADMTHILMNGSTLSLPDNKIGTQVKIAIKRISATGGTEYPNHVFVTQVGFHCEKDTMGSRSISTK